jgi:TATA-box binding protein (TBP) (component of TFIID and TFIIIB)
MVASLFCIVSFGNTVMLTTRETKLDFQLQSFQWKKTLSDAEKEKIVSALASDKDPIVRSALKVVAVHKVKDAVPALKKGIGVSDIDLNLFAKLIADAIDSNKDLDIQLENMTFSDEVTEKDREKIKEYVNQVEVIKETKSRRDGSKSITKLEENLKLTKLQTRLLSDARNKEDITINNIVDSLSTAKIAGADQYDLVNILRTYEPNSVQAVIQKLSNEEQVKDMSPYGKVLLLNFLDISIYTISDEDRNHCKIVFERFINDEPKVSMSATWALEHIKQLEALEN